MSENSNNKTIAKNTLALYFRMGITILVGMFTSRVILQVLGVTDMGINATVGGVVAFVGFLNAALSNGTSRFLTVALGKSDRTMFETISFLSFMCSFNSTTIVILYKVGLTF